MSKMQVGDVGQDTPAELRRRPRPQFDEPDELKAERVQEPLTAAQVTVKLQAMPGWKMTPGGSAINRTHFFPEVRVACAYIVFIAELAQSVKQTVAVTQRGRRVVVMLRAPLRRMRRGGITEAVLNLAKQLC